MVLGDLEECLVEVLVALVVRQLVQLIMLQDQVVVEEAVGQEEMVVLEVLVSPLQRILGVLVVLRD